MKLKTVEVSGKTYAEMLDGKPVFIEDDGKEVAVDVPHTRATINRMNGEVKTLRERAEAAEAKLKPFEGIDDADAAKKAVEMLKNIDEGKLLSAGKVEEIKSAAKKAAEEQVAAANKSHTEELAKTKAELDKRTSELNNHMIGGGFSRSKLIVDEKHPIRLAIPADIAEARFGKNFRVEEGKVIGYDGQGNKIYSRARPGEVADFDEALETLVDQYPYKDQILRGSGAKGDGARNSNGSGHGGAKTITRREFDALDPIGRQAKMAERVTVVD